MRSPLGVTRLRAGRPPPLVFYHGVLCWCFMLVFEGGDWRWCMRRGRVLEHPPFVAPPFVASWLSPSWLPPSWLPPPWLPPACLRPRLCRNATPVRAAGVSTRSGRCACVFSLAFGDGGRMPPPLGSCSVLRYRLLCGIANIAVSPMAIAGGTPATTDMCWWDVGVGG